MHQDHLTSFLPSPRCKLCILTPFSQVEACETNIDSLQLEKAQHQRQVRQEFLDAHDNFKRLQSELMCTCVGSTKRYETSGSRTRVYVRVWH